MFWTKDKNKILDKFIDTGPTLEAYDQKFVYYTETAAELDKIKDFYDIGPIRVNKRPLLNQVIDHTLKWKYVLGQKMTANVLQKMNDFKEMMEVIKLLVYVSYFAM